MAARRFSQAISEGDGISVLVEVGDAGGAHAAETQGADAIVVRGPFDGLRDSTGLPILWSAGGSLAAAANAGADACVISVEQNAEDDGRLERLFAEASDLGLDCVIEVRNEDEIELALERIDPEILLLAGDGEHAGGGPLEPALELLPDVPAGKLAIADVPVAGRDQVAELERAGVDAVIVAVADVAELVGDAPPQV